MSTTETLKTLTEAQGCKFMIANIYEANFNLDQFLTNVDFPVHVLLPYEVRDVMGDHGVIRSELVLDGFFLTRMAEPTIGYDTSKADIEAVEPMRAMARKFFDALSLESIINSEVTDISVSYIPTYANFDAHLHGINYRTSIPVIEEIECE